jgi:hypothetical protein
VGYRGLDFWQRFFLFRKSPIRWENNSSQHLTNPRAQPHQNHYLQVTDAHLAKAIADDVKKAAQNPAQQPNASGKTAWQQAKGGNINRPELPSDCVP